jgi:hypothetical protein
LQRPATAVIEIDGNRQFSSCLHLSPHLFQKPKRGDADQSFSFSFSFNTILP